MPTLKLPQLLSVLTTMRQSILTRRRMRRTKRRRSRRQSQYSAAIFHITTCLPSARNNPRQNRCLCSLRLRRSRKSLLSTATRKFLQILPRIRLSSERQKREPKQGPPRRLQARPPCRQLPLLRCICVFLQACRRACVSQPHRNRKTPLRGFPEIRLSRGPPPRRACRSCRRSRPPPPPF